MMPGRPACQASGKRLGRKYARGEALGVHSYAFNCPILYRPSRRSEGALYTIWYTEALLGCRVRLDGLYEASDESLCGLQGLLG
jgi:hypothetical protein